jgi:GTPase SAR1 family protein
MERSGKNTTLHALYRIIRERNTSFHSTSDIESELIEGIEVNKVSLQHAEAQINVYVIVDEQRFSKAKIKLCNEADAVIFIFDAQPHLFEDNLESLKELEVLMSGRLVKEIPLIVMLNKTDEYHDITVDDVKEVLGFEDLWYGSTRESIKNLMIFETCSLYEHENNVYSSFLECMKNLKKS